MFQDHAYKYCKLEAQKRELAHTSSVKGWCTSSYQFIPVHTRPLRAGVLIWSILRCLHALIFQELLLLSILLLQSDDLPPINFRLGYCFVFSVVRGVASILAEAATLVKYSGVQVKQT